MESWSWFAWAILGGTLPEFLALYDAIKVSQAANKIDARTPLKQPLYWITRAVMVLLGGLLALAYIGSGAKLNPILAINVGASAPVILRTLSTTLPRDLVKTD